MGRKSLITSAMAFWLAIGDLAPAVLADGVYFPLLSVGSSSDLAQTRQEVLMAVYEADDQPFVTYVLRTRYAGTPAELAWVVPVPATPTGVTAHDTNDLFDVLDASTRPTFYIWRPASGWPAYFGCGAGGAGLGGAEDTTELVTMEAQGQAGIYEWAALTSTGSTALLSWLNDNGFAIPETADPILQQYIDEAWRWSPSTRGATRICSSRSSKTWISGPMHPRAPAICVI